MMSTRMICQTLLVMSLTLGSMAWGVQMPQTINNDRDLKAALKAAQSPEDHERIAVYYQEKADRLDAEATGYERMAESSRNGPVVKNITAPNTAARYDAIAKELRNQAESNRVLAASQDKKARDAEQASK